MKLNFPATFFVIFLFGIIVLCTIIAKKPLFQTDATLRDVLNHNPLSPHGVRQLTRDIQKNEETIDTLSKQSSSNLNSELK